jgi:hypothetical protein
LRDIEIGKVSPTLCKTKEEKAVENKSEQKGEIENVDAQPKKWYAFLLGF